MAEYYVVRDKNTGLYFRGKGVNRWGKHYNQASIYRIKANAENTIKEVSWRGEQAEIVPIQIVETTEDVVPKSEVEQLKAEKDALIKNYAECMKDYAREIFEEIDELLIQNATMQIATSTLHCKLAELKKKYTKSEGK